MLQVPKLPELPEFQKIFGCRYRSLPVCCKFPSYQSSRSFLVADTDLCLCVAKLQVTRVPEVFWAQIPISACMLQSSQVTRVPEVFWSQIPISACLLQSSKLPEFQKFFWSQ